MCFLGTRNKPRRENEREHQLCLINPGHLFWLLMLIQQLPAALLSHMLCTKLLSLLKNTFSISIMLSAVVKAESRVALPCCSLWCFSILPREGTLVFLSCTVQLSFRCSLSTIIQTEWNTLSQSVCQSAQMLCLLTVCWRFMSQGASGPRGYHIMRVMALLSRVPS